MKRFSSVFFTFFTVLLVLILISSCNLPTGGSSASADLAVTQTLAALATQVAAAQAALPQPSATAQPLPPAVATPLDNTPAPVSHLIMPRDMQTIESTVDDVLYAGDNYAANIYERPYTPEQMVYRPDLDLQKNVLSTDSTFFYFALNVKDIYPETKTLIGSYAVELDVNRDGRGEYLIWVSAPHNAADWVTDGVAVFTDLNKDVGGPRPLLSDAPFSGDGYETQLWPTTPLTDADGAWTRLDPNSPLTIQIAVKRSLVGNPASFMWGAWADDLVKSPSLFDYNDAFTLDQAGSLVKASANYPLKKLSLLDNTCRGAWGFTPTGNEPGLCKKATPTAQPTRAQVQPSRTQVQVTVTPFVITKTPVPQCADVQVGAQVTDGSKWDPAWASAVTLCVGSDCKNPDSSGYAFWYLPASGYTITASSNYGISPSSVGVKLGCGEKSLSQFVIGPG
jgi:hypothetical protein